jgi:hypothetical protein
MAIRRDHDGITSHRVRHIQRRRISVESRVSKGHDPELMSFLEAMEVAISVSSLTSPHPTLTMQMKRMSPFIQRVQDDIHNFDPFIHDIELITDRRGLIGSRGDLEE